MRLTRHINEDWRDSLTIWLIVIGLYVLGGAIWIGLRLVDSYRAVRHECWLVGKAIASQWWRAWFECSRFHDWLQWQLCYWRFRLRMRFLWTRANVARWLSWTRTNLNRMRIFRRLRTTEAKLDNAIHSYTNSLSSVSCQLTVLAAQVEELRLQRANAPIASTEDRL